MYIKTFKSNSTQLMENKKWTPCGTLFEVIDYGKQIITKTDNLPVQFNTKEEADRYFESYYLNQGYKPAKIN